MMKTGLYVLVSVHPTTIDNQIMKTRRHSGRSKSLERWIIDPYRARPRAIPQKLSLFFVLLGITPSELIFYLTKKSLEKRENHNLDTSSLSVSLSALRSARSLRWPSFGLNLEWNTGSHSDNRSAYVKLPAHSMQSWQQQQQPVRHEQILANVRPMQRRS